MTLVVLSRIILLIFLQAFSALQQYEKGRLSMVVCFNDILYIFCVLRVSALCVFSQLNEN